MEDIKIHAPGVAQVDPAVDLGVTAPPLPELKFYEDFMPNRPPAPPQLIEGMLHQGCKMILGATSKSNKSWCLLDLALSVASGTEWWGCKCTRVPAVYVNFELQPWVVGERLAALQTARPECKLDRGMFAIWNLRGHNADLTVLRPMLEQELIRHQFGLIILDPAYKLLGDRDENANGEIADLMNQFENLAQKTGAAIVLAHHFAKGDSTAKSALDRMSGAGAWARDPDSLVILTPHEEPGCVAVTSILRNQAQRPDFVVRWEFPVMKVASDLNPEALRRPQSKSKVCTDKEFMEKLVPATPTARSTIISAARDLGISSATTDRYLKRLSDAGLICCGSGLYWRSEG